MTQVNTADIHTAHAHAKLTLSLRITGVRADGFHLIDAEMISLELADIVRIDPNREGITVDGPFAAGVPTTADNLVSRALRLLDRSAAVRITKNIPNGGGLGGGSADAAAVLQWGRFDDLVAASRLGADIPFCMVGGRARVQGIGEIVEPFAAHQRTDEPIDVTLVIPPLHMSTPIVYKAWDSMTESERRGTHNDLEPAALKVEPQLGRWRDRIREATGAMPTLAGSGATWFVRGKHDVADAFNDATVIVTRSR